MSKIYFNEVFIPLMNRRLGSSQIQKLRREILADVCGSVLEIGFGSGLNLDCYPVHINSITAIDVFSPRIAQPFSRIRVNHQVMSAENLAFPDNCFDSVVSTFTLCSISKIDAALMEIARVLKPHGRFFFLEHGRSDDHSISWFQDLLNPMYNIMACGCNVNRDLKNIIATNGLRFQFFNQQIYGSPITGSYFSGIATNKGTSQ
jgi:ubiquinone/menaquinone biosynthesis C-methylase UbiE